MARNLYLLLLFLPLAFSISQIQDGLLDPAPITWWQSTWTHTPIELSRSNASSTSVTITIRFRPTTTITNGVVNVVIPSGFTGVTNNLYEQSNVSYTGGNDETITITGVTLPSTAGGYGNFEVMTRLNSNGQIVDYNKNFGAVFVSEKETTDTGLEVTLAEGIYETEVQQTATLFFNFIVNFDLWPNDTFVIKVDSDWSLVKSPACNSVSYVQGATNYLLSASNTNTLDCIYDSASSQLFIYGMSKDVDVSELGGSNTQLDAKLSVDQFTAPIADYAISSYAWQIEVWRWGTRHVLKKYTGNGPETKPGVLTIDSFVSSNGYPQGYIKQGMKLYMDLTFTTHHLMQEGGYIDFYFTGSLVNALYKCYFNYANTSCTVGGAGNKRLSLTFGADADLTTTYTLAPATYTVSVHYSFDEAVTRISGISTISSGQEIAKTSQDFQLNYPPESKVIKLDTFAVNLTTDDSGTSASFKTASTAQHFAGKFTYAVGFPAGVNLSSVYIRAPLSNTRLHETKFFVLPHADSGATLKSQYRFEPTTGSNTFDITTEDGTLPATSDNDKLDMTTQGVTIDVSGQQFGLFAFYNTQSDGTTKASTIQYPMVGEINSSSALISHVTRYESWIILNTSDQMVYVQAYQFLEAGATYIVPDEFGTKVIKSICGDLLFFSLQVNNSLLFTDTTSRTYYLDITFDGANNGLGTLLNDGEEYTAYFISNPLAQFQFVGSSKTIRSIGNLNYPSTTNYQFYAFAEFATSPANVNVKVYYKESVHLTTEEFISNMTTVNVTTNSATNLALDANISVNADNTTSQTITNYTSINGTTTDFTPTAKPFMVQLGKYYYQSNSALTYENTPTTNASQTFILQLKNSFGLYEYSAIVAHDIVLPVDTGFQLTGILNPQFASSSNVFYGSESQCRKNTGTTDLVTQNLTLIPTFSPTSTQGRGPTSYHVDVTASFSTVVSLIANSSLTLQHKSAWVALLSQPCQITGVEVGAASDITYNSGTRTCTFNNIKATEGAATITVTLKNMLPPVYDTNTGATNQVYHVDSIVLSSKGAQVVGNYSAQADQPCTITSPEPPGTVTIDTTTTLIPSNQGVSKSDLFLKFTLAHIVPAGAKIAITSPTQMWGTPSTNSKDYVYCNQEFSSVVVTGSVLTLTMRYDSLVNFSCYIEDAITTTFATAGYFRIVTTYANDLVTIDNDFTLTTPEDSSKLTLDSLITGVLTLSYTPITVNTSTAGMEADYTFEFTSSERIVEGDRLWIVFPRANFSPYLGSAYKKYPFSEPNTYFVECESDSFSNIDCIIDRWIVIVRNLPVSNANTAIKFTIKDVRNPGVTVITDNFQFLHMDGSSFKAKSAQFEVEGIAITAFPANLSVKSVTNSYDYTFGNGNYVFEMYVGQDLTSDMDIMIKLPRQFNTRLSNTYENLTCSLSHYDERITATDSNEQKIDDITSCEVDRNYISVEIPTGQTLTYGNADTRVVFQINNLDNPEWGYSRAQLTEYRDFDAVDTDAFTVYDLWANQFEVYVHDNKQKVDLNLSYMNVNAAYLGFQPNQRGFIVNSYNPQTRANHIKVIPGTQTVGIVIKTTDGFPLAAKKVSFLPSVNTSTEDNGKILFTSPLNNFIMFHRQKQIVFNLGAANNLDKGVYYINWNIDETWQNSLSSNQYNPPPKIFVEVYDEAKAQFQVDLVPSVLLGYKSRPVRIWTLNPPHTSVTLNLSLVVPSDNITIQPSAITFRADDTQKFFQISVSEDYDIQTETNSKVIQFRITGTDASAYNDMSTVSVQIDQVSAQEPPQVQSCAPTSTPSRTSVTVETIVNRSGIVYWLLATRGTTMPTAQELIDLVGDYFEIEGDNDNDLFQEVETEPSNDDLLNDRVEPWISYQRREYASFLQKTFYGADIVDAQTPKNIIQLSTLFAQTNYQNICFLDDLRGNVSEGLTAEWSTLSLYDAVSFDITLNGEYSLTYLNSLRNAMATALGISTYRPLNGERILARRLQEGDVIKTTTYRWIIPDTRYLESPSPSEVANLGTTAKKADKEYLEQQVRQIVTGYNGTISLSYAAIPASTYQTPDWVAGSEPALYDSPDMTQLTAAMRCNTLGEVCGTCEPSATSTEINHLQILLGLDSKNIATNGGCVNFDDLSEDAVIQITGLEEGTNYRCSFMCYNRYPVWPGYVPYSSTNPIKSFSVTTASVIEDDDDFSWALKVGLALLAIIA